jgi:hypothetical protein
MIIVIEANTSTRFLRVASGIIAFMPLSFSQVRKITNTPTVPQNKPMMVADFHAYLIPPQSKAKSNMMTPGANIAKPIRSRRFKLSFKVTLAPVLLAALGIRKSEMIPRVIAPKGRFK